MLCTRKFCTIQSIDRNWSDWPLLLSIPTQLRILSGVVVDTNSAEMLSVTTLHQYYHWRRINQRTQRRTNRIHARLLLKKLKIFALLLLVPWDVQKQDKHIIMNKSSKKEKYTCSKLRQLFNVKPKNIIIDD